MYAVFCGTVGQDWGRSGSADVCGFFPGGCGALQRRFTAGTHIALTGKTTYRYLTALNAVMMSGCTAVPLAASHLCPK